MKKSVVFMGGKEIGYTCFQHLLSKADELNFEIAYALINDRMLFDSNLSLTELCKENNVTILNSLDEFISTPNCDIIISVQYHEILKNQHIEKAKQIAVNLHMAPVPEYRGCNQFTFAILDEVKVFGTTIHRLEESIDAGDVLFEKRFPIPKKCFVKDLYIQTFNQSVKLFKEVLPAIIKGDYKGVSQKKLAETRSTSYHFRSEINTVKQIDKNWDAEKQKRYFRATYLPPFPPPEMEGKQLTMDWYNNL